MTRKKWVSEQRVAPELANVKKRRKLILGWVKENPGATMKEIVLALAERLIRSCGVNCASEIDLDKELVLGMKGRINNDVFRLARSRELSAVSDEKNKNRNRYYLPSDAPPATLKSVATEDESAQSNEFFFSYPFMLPSIAAGFAREGSAAPGRPVSRLSAPCNPRQGGQGVIWNRRGGARSSLEYI